MKSISHYFYFLVLAFGFLLGRLSINGLHKKETIIENVKHEEKKEEISTQANTKKDSTLDRQTLYTEKFYDDKGLLTRETSMQNLNRAIASQTTVIELTQKNDLTLNSMERVTTVERYQSNWKVGVFFPAQNIYEPKNFVTDPKKIYAAASYRVFDNFEIIGMFNYQFKTQVGFMVGL